MNLLLHISTLHYLADEVESYFDDGKNFGVSLHYVVEDTPLGTAGAVKMAHELLASDTFLVISGDALTDINLTDLIAHHKREENAVTIALQRVTNPLEFGVVVTDENGNAKLSFDYPEGPVTPRAEKLPEPRRAKKRRASPRRKPPGGPGGNTPPGRGSVPKVPLVKV